MSLNSSHDRFRIPLHFELEDVPAYISPKPATPTIQRKDDLSIQVIMNAHAPGCSQVNDGPALRMGEMGLAALFKGNVDSIQTSIEFYSWIDHSDCNFKSGEITYFGPVTGARLIFDKKKLSRHCIVRCSSGPKIWGPDSVKFVFKTNEYEIILYKTPGWSTDLRCTTLEIKSAHDLNEELIEDIIVALSFVSGRRIAEYEVEFLDKDGSPILIIMNPPHIYSLKEYSEDSRSPFLDSPYLLFKDADIWSQILELTLNFGKKLPLRNILVNIWFARPLPLGGNIIFYAAALESLVNSWFNLSENKLKANRLPQTEFSAITSTIISKMKEFETTDPRWKKVREVIENANRYSGISKIMRFYELQDLVTNDVEDTIREVRNRFAHGADFSTEEDAILLALTNAGETLLNRIILKLIGYKGKYIDYSTYDFPMRNLNDPLGGPKGDGKLHCK